MGSVSGMSEGSGYLRWSTLVFEKGRQRPLCWLPPSTWGLSATPSEVSGTKSPIMVCFLLPCSNCPHGMVCSD